jgi:predicted site-specific integrase-resolvase
MKVVAITVDFYTLYMLLHEYANKMGVTYTTAFRWWKASRLDAYQLDTGTEL